MRFDEMRDNIMDTERTIIHGDYRDDLIEDENDVMDVMDQFDDVSEDDGQPDEYTEWQDVYGGDDWDHGQYDDCGG
jgi:hypothetical protein